jgi:signal transduction histidine kinase
VSDPGLYTKVVNARDTGPADAGPAKARHHVTPNDVSQDTHTIPARLVTAIGIGTAAILALAVSTQTYLSMLGHGHAFHRIFIWQLSSWSYWGFVAPLVLRRGAAAAAGGRPGWRVSLRLVLMGLALMAAHVAIASQLAVWSQPFTPVETYRFTGALVRQAPAYLAIDPLAYVLLLVVGGALAAHRRAQRLALRESRLEAELTRAQLHALRLEIEPHFLFNTLNAIAALIRLKDSRRALDMLVNLSEFMRANLDQSRDQLVPLSTEVEWVRRYVALQQTRFSDRLDVRYEVDADCLEVTIPTLLLQPIVENALRHGAARQTGRCHIVIGAARDRQRLRLWVHDDGPGLRLDFAIDRHAGTGLRNTRSRLEQLYGGAATFDLQSSGGQTIVEIALPIPAVIAHKASA